MIGMADEELDVDQNTLMERAVAMIYDDFTSHVHVAFRFNIVHVGR